MLLFKCVIVRKAVLSLKKKPCKTLKLMTVPFPTATVRRTLVGDKVHEGGGHTNLLHALA